MSIYIDRVTGLCSVVANLGVGRGGKCTSGLKVTVLCFAASPSSPLSAANFLLIYCTTFLK